MQLTRAEFDALTQLPPGMDASELAVAGISADKSNDSLYSMIIALQFRVQSAEMRIENIMANLSLREE